MYAMMTYGYDVELSDGSPLSWSAAVAGCCRRLLLPAYQCVFSFHWIFVSKWLWVWLNLCAHIENIFFPDKNETIETVVALK